MCKKSNFIFLRLISALSPDYPSWWRYSQLTCGSCHFPLELWCQRGLALGQWATPVSFLSLYVRSFRLNNCPGPSGQPLCTEMLACSAGPWGLGDVIESCLPAQPTWTCLLWVVDTPPLLSDFLNWLCHLNMALSSPFDQVLIVVRSLSHVQLFANPWITTHQASLSFTLSWSLLKLMSVESVMPSSHLIFCCPLLLLPSIFPSIKTFSSVLVLCIRWPKYWTFSFSISPPNEYTELISFKIDSFDLLAVQGIHKSLLQHHSSKASVLQLSAFFIV